MQVQGSAGSNHSLKQESTRDEGSNAFQGGAGEVLILKCPRDDQNERSEQVFKSCEDHSKGSLNKGGSVDTRLGRSCWWGMSKFGAIVLIKITENFSWRFGNFKDSE